MQTPDVQTQIARLFIYPVKSCAGIEVREAELTETGFDLDRAWMVVDGQGQFVSQRELPRMALIQPRIRLSDVVLRAPGMLALHLGIETVEKPARVRVWDDEVDAWDMGDTAAQWLSDFLGRKLRLVRFDPEVRRVAAKKWTGEVEALNAFSDGFPLLVTSEGSLAELNRRLQAAGQPAVGIERFRPNIVLAGLDPNDEDRMGDIRVQADAPIVLRPVKPCARCTIPDVDPATGERGSAVGDTLRAYRSSPSVLDGAVTFAMNAVIVEGFGQVLKVGQPVASNWRFD